MKILMLTSNLGLGGQQKVIYDLSNHLTEKHFEVIILSLTDSNVPVHLNEKIKVIALKKWRFDKKGFFLFPLTLYALIRVIKIVKPDIVHSHGMDSHILSRFSRLFVTFGKLINTSHSKYEGGRLKCFFARILDPFADVFTHVSSEAIRYFEKNGIARKGRMICVPNGINLEKFNFKEGKLLSKSKTFCENGEKILLNIGRMDPQKDQKNLLKAFSLLEYKNLRLLIVGSGELENELRQLAIKLKIIEQVSFLGVRNDIEYLMHLSDVFVLSSNCEGFSLVVLEAMACGVPVVATDSCGPKEVLGGTGSIVPISSPQELASAINKVLVMDQQLLKKNILKARMRVEEKYVYNIIINKWIKIYEG